MKNTSRFRKNQETVTSPDGRKLFTPGNYLFSTKAEDREETLYFRNRATKQTGRLRQQHWDAWRGVSVNPVREDEAIYAGLLTTESQRAQIRQ